MSKVTTKHFTGFADGKDWYTLFSELVDDLEALKTLVNELKTDLHQHTHQVTHAACAATDAAYPTATALTSTVGPDITSPAINLKTTK